MYRDILAGGGYPRDIRWLAGALQRRGVNVTVFGCQRPLNNEDGLNSAVAVHTQRSLLRDCARLDLVHVFGFFCLSHPILAMACTLHGAPLVISPMAHLLPFHMATKRWKKESFFRLAWLPWLGNVRAFHVFSELEAKSVSSWVHGASVFEGTLGVFPIPGGPRVARDTKPRREILFFGRNDVYQKGLDILLEAWASTVKSLGSRAELRARLTIAGQSWNNSDSWLEKSLRKFSIRDSVKIFGQVDEEAKWRLLGQTDYLVFLSRWDGPPRPVREAIAAGTPVIVTPETNMGAFVEKFDAGLQVQLEPMAVTEGLLRAIRDDDLLARCRGGAETLREHLSWDRVADDYVNGYKSLLFQEGPRSRGKYQSPPNLSIPHADVDTQSILRCTSLDRSVGASSPRGWR